MSESAKDRNDKLRHDIIADCKILYQMADKPCSETTMCWGLQVGDGWLEKIHSMSQKLEALNLLFYPKFRVRIQMEEVKEKFSILECYHSVVVDPPAWMLAWQNACNWLFGKTAKLDFGLVEMVDELPHQETSIIELESREEYENEKDTNKYCCNVDVYEQDGKFYKKTVYDRYMQSHQLPTKHKLLYKLLKRKYFIERLPMDLFKFSPSVEQMCIQELLDEKAYAIVSSTSKACQKVCELCGKQITDKGSWSPACTTRGYIQRLCQTCADESGREYEMRGAIWSNGKQVLSKEEYAKEQAELKAKYEDYDDCEEEKEEDM